VAHNKEDNFLVANRVPEASGTAEKKTPPVSLLTGTLAGTVSNHQRDRLGV